MKSVVKVLAVVLALALPVLAVAQTTLTVDPGVNKFLWNQSAGAADGSQTPESFTFTCGGVTQGGFAYVTGQSAYQTLINQVVNTPGTYACNVRAVNAAGQSAPSNTVSILIPQTYQLAVQKTGSGTVTSVPAGINCGPTCNMSIVQGTSVTLTAAPAAGYVFKGWSGDCTGTAPTCTVTMNSARATTAGFLGVPLAPTTLTVN